MADHRTVTPGYAVVFPNREKATSKLMKAVVALILLATVALLLIVTIGGWSQLEGMKPINFFLCVAYLIIAFYIFVRWARGMLPIAAGLAILLLMIAIVAELVRSQPRRVRPREVAAGRSGAKRRHDRHGHPAAHPGSGAAHLVRPA